MQALQIGQIRQSGCVRRSVPADPESRRCRYSGTVAEQLPVSPCKPGGRAVSGTVVGTVDRERDLAAEAVVVRVTKVLDLPPAGRQTYQRRFGSGDYAFIRALGVVGIVQGSVHIGNISEVVNVLKLCGNCRWLRFAVPALLFCGADVYIGVRGVSRERGSCDIVSARAACLR